jgi:DNA mismatch repair protein MutS
VVVSRAREILGALEQDELARGGRPSVTPTSHGPQQQLGLFQFAPAADHVAERLRAVDIDRLTPLEALTLLADLKKEAGA